jgi:hypothetical protein
MDKLLGSTIHLDQYCETERHRLALIEEKGSKFGLSSIVARRVLIIGIL